MYVKNEHFIYTFYLCCHINPLFVTIFTPFYIQRNMERLSAPYGICQDHKDVSKKTQIYSRDNVEYYTNYYMEYNSLVSALLTPILYTGGIAVLYNIRTSQYKKPRAVPSSTLCIASNQSIA